MYINGKHCCNCQYWNGPRKTNRALGSKAEIKNLSDLGLCTNPKGVNVKGKEWRADKSSCSSFQKWDQLP